MSLLNIEGITEGIQDVQIQFIRDVLEKRGFKNNRVIFGPASKTGDNYVANVNRITVVVADGEDFNMIGKFAPNNEVLRQNMNIDILFSNETVMYEEFLPKLRSLQIAADVPEQDFLRFAECYGCYTEKPNEVILLEDLKESDFVMLDRLSSLSNEAVRLILKNFAILHSFSYVLKKNEPETYERFKNKLMNMWIQTEKTDDFEHFMSKVEENAVSVLDDESYKKTVQAAISQTISSAHKNRKADANSKHLVIQHGDSWTNNIMFKMEGDIPVQGILIDYQISSEGSPLADILYMIFTSTDHATRAEHYHDWIAFYHDQLDKSLSNFGMKANFVYPRDQVDADLRRYSKVFFGLSVMLYGMLCRNSEEAAGMHDAMEDENDKKNIDAFMAVNNLSVDTVQLYKSRIEGLVESYRLFGYL